MAQLIYFKMGDFPVRFLCKLFLAAKIPSYPIPSHPTSSHGLQRQLPAEFRHVIPRRLRARGLRLRHRCHRCHRRRCGLGGPGGGGFTWDPRRRGSDQGDCNYLYVIYIYRLKAGGSPELRGTLSLDAIPERSFLYTDGGGGGGVIMWSALDDVESWKMLLGWKMLLRCKFRCCLQKGGWGVGGCNNVMSSALDVITSCQGAFFISSMVLQCIITCSTSEQNDQNKRNRTSNG